MKACAKCGVELQCIKNGVGLDFGNGHVYSADLYKCVECGAEFANSNQNAYSDRDYDMRDYYITMHHNSTTYNDNEVTEVLSKLHKGNKLDKHDDVLMESIKSIDFSIDRIEGK